VFPLPVGKNEKHGDAPLAKLPDDEIATIHEELRLKALNPYRHITLPRATGIKINSVRELRKESSLTLFGKGKRVFIIMNAEELNDEASNALLKILEEPHANTMLILTTPQPDKLLPTIISRCQHIRFDLLSEQEIQQALQEREGLSQQESVLISRLANGSYSRALEFNGTQLAERRAEAVEFLRIILYKSKQELLAEIERVVSEYERNEIGEFLSLLQSWLRSALLIREGSPQFLDAADDDTLKKFSAHHATIEYATLFDRMERAISLIDKNVYIPLVLINLSLDLRRTILATPARQ
jgi:DNA polymerase-3 subunit delta'